MYKAMIRIKTALAYLVAGTLLLTMVGCTFSKEGEAFPSISFLAISLDNDISGRPLRQEIIDAYEQHTGIHVDWTWVSDNVYSGNLARVLQDKSNIPMIITVKGNIQGNIIKEAKKGSFWNLKSFLEDKESFPNLAAANPDILKALTVDREIIGIYSEREIGRYGLVYRSDWAEAVGIKKEPETIEEVYEMLYAFTYGDPDGNGKDDTYGLEMTNYMGPFNIMQTWFGCGNGWIVSEDGDSLIPVHQTQQYMEALRWFRRLYEEGLMRPDFPLVSSDCFGDGIKNGEAGVIVDVAARGPKTQRYFESYGIKSAVDENSIATVCMVGPIEGNTLATNGYGCFFCITKDGAKTKEDVINCLTYLDKMGDQEMLILVEYGLEGVSYEIDDEGRLMAISGVYNPGSELSQTLTYITEEEIPTEKKIQTDILNAQDLFYKRNEAAAVYNPAVGYLSNSTVNAEYGVILSEILEDARVKYICGQISEKEFLTELTRWEEQGGNALIKEINALYQADLAGQE